MTTIEEESMVTTTLTPERAREQLDALKSAGYGDEENGGERGASQLSFDVGGREPNRTSLKTSVDILIPRELPKGSEIRIAVTGPDGELLAQTRGKVVGVTFEDEYKDGFIVGSERVHKVKLGI